MLSRQRIAGSGYVRFPDLEVRSTSDSRRRWARSAKTGGFDPELTNPLIRSERSQPRIPKGIRERLSPQCDVSHICVSTRTGEVECSMRSQAKTLVSQG